MTIKSKKRPTLGTALVDSIGAEEKSIESRFDRAETLFQQKEQRRPQNETNVSMEEDETAIVEPAPIRHLESPKSSKPKPKEKVIRDTFTMPKAEHQHIAEIQKRVLKAGISITKSEVVRAGLIALEGLSSKELHATLRSVEKLKPGRPPG